LKLRVINDNIDIIKQIGRGSFSNVYLCKNEESMYIIKEININALVKKYMSKHKGENKIFRYIKKNDTQLSTNITPYNDEMLIIKENEYYYKRLKELIDSEIEILKCMNNKNIIHFYEYTKQYGIYYLNMEYCDKGDLYDILKNSSEYKRNIFSGMSSDFVYEFIKQITDGLDYIFERNIIHRDIKLHNILVSKKGSELIFKISDFGFACYDMSKNKECHFESSHFSDFTSASMSTNEKKKSNMDEVLMKKYYKLCGTPYYMAPELILNMNLLEDFTQYEEKKNERCIFYNNKIDLWSYGVCIYELVFNTLPFPNVKNIKELEMFYKQTNIAEEYISKQINGKKSIDIDIKKILFMLLQVKMDKRTNIEQFKNYINNIKSINNKNEILNELDLNELKDIINCDKNMYKDTSLEQVKLKQHIVSRPIKKDSIIESWEELVNYDSILKNNKSIEKGFLDWLIK
jgi:serine/threonine protein kinase